MSDVMSLHHPDPALDPQFYRGVLSKRALAWVIDAAIILALWLVVSTVFGLVTFGIGFLAAPVLMFLVSLSYRWATISRRSATPGMRFFGIEFRTAQGARFDSGHAFWHSLMFVLLMGSLIGWLISVIAMLGTEKSQGLPDLILGTTVINRPVDF